jgi:hypothetical protein
VCDKASDQVNKARVRLTVRFSSTHFLCEICRPDLRHLVPAWCLSASGGEWDEISPWHVFCRSEAEYEPFRSLCLVVRSVILYYFTNYAFSDIFKGPESPSIHPSAHGALAVVPLSQNFCHFLADAHMLSRLKTSKHNNAAHYFLQRR